jgi:hypothetical protein
MSGPRDRGGARDRAHLRPARSSRAPAPAVAPARLGGRGCVPMRAAKWQPLADAVERVARAQAGPGASRRAHRSRPPSSLSAVRPERGIDHVVLNAMQDRDEAMIVARAGRSRPRERWPPTWPAAAPTSCSAPGVAARGGLQRDPDRVPTSRAASTVSWSAAARAQGDPAARRRSSPSTTNSSSCTPAQARSLAWDAASFAAR